MTWLRARERRNSAWTLRIALRFERHFDRTCARGRVHDLHHGPGDIGSRKHRRAIEPLVARDQRRIDKSRNDHRDLEAALAQLAERRARERDESSLGRGIDGLAG